MKYIFIDDCYKSNNKNVEKYITNNSVTNIWQANLNKNFLLRLNYFEDYDDNPYYFKVCHWMYNHYLNPDERLTRKINFEKIIKSNTFPVICGSYFDSTKNVITDFEMLQNTTVFYIKDDYIYDIINDTRTKIDTDMIISYYFIVYKMNNCSIYYMYINNLLCNNNIEINDNYNNKTDFKIKDCIFSSVDNDSGIYSKLIYPKPLNEECKLFYYSDHNYKFSTEIDMINIDLRYEDDMDDKSCSTKGLKQEIDLDIEVITTNTKNISIDKWLLSCECIKDYSYILLKINNDNFFDDTTSNKNTVFLEIMKQ